MLSLYYFVFCFILFTSRSNLHHTSLFLLLGSIHTHTHTHASLLVISLFVVFVAQRPSTMLHTSSQRSNTTSLQLTSPFILTSPSPSPTHAALASAAATAATTTATTTTIEMDSAEESESHTGGASLTLPTAVDHVRHDEQEQDGRTRRMSLTTYQLASAALRRLPARPPPTTQQQEVAQDKVGRINQGTASSAAPAATPSLSLQATSVHRDGLSSPLTSSLPTATSPGSRFRVPPPSASPSSLSPTATATAPAAHARSFSPASQARAVSHSERYEYVDEEEQHEVDEEEEEEDVAARVLLSLQHKDDVIGQLSHAMEVLRAENEALRRRAGAAPASSPLPTVTGVKIITKEETGRVSNNNTNTHTTPEKQRVRREGTHGVSLLPTTASPSPPVTPVRWWKQPKTDLAATATATISAEERGDDADITGERRTTRADVSNNVHTSPLPSRASFSAAHAAVETVAALQTALTQREAELAAVTAQLVQLQTRHREECSSTSSTASEGGDDDAGATARVINKGHRSEEESGMSAMQAALDAAHAHAARLEYQLESLQEEKREDQRTLREHIDHLSRELKTKDKELRRQERQHKLELAGLQREVSALADQLEGQLRTATAVGTSSVSQQDALQRQVVEARQRETAMRREHAAAQQQWRTEVEEQKTMLDALRRQVRETEAQVHTRTEQEAALVQRLSAQQQQLEAQLCEWKANAAQAQTSLAELRSVHQRTEEVVAVQRAEARELAESLATTTLQHAHAEQQVVQLEGQVQLLQQQVRQLAVDAAAREEEIAELRHTKETEVSEMLQQHDDEYRHLLRQVEGCMKGSEAVENALLTAEAQRREVVSQLTQALADKDAVHQRLRETSVQAQAQLLEQQQLFQEVQAALQERCTRTQQQLAEESSALQAAQQELHDTQSVLRQQEEEAAELAKDKTQLSGQLRSAEEAASQLTARLVDAKETLKDTLQSQLLTTRQLQRVEQQRRTLQEAAQRAAERQVRERDALQKVVSLLKGDATTQASTLSTRHDRSRLSTTTSVPARTRGALLNRTEKKVNVAYGHKNMNDNTARICHLEVNSSSRASSASASASASSSASSSSSSSSILAASSTVESVPMSAVDTISTTRTPPSSVCHDARDTAGMHHSRRTARASLQRIHVTQEASIVKSSEGAMETSTLSALAALHHDLQHLLHAHRTQGNELNTKRLAVRTLVQERKLQQQALEAARKALIDQRSDAEKHQQDLTLALRAEAQSAIDKLTSEAEGRHTSAMECQRDALTQQHTQQLQHLQQRCATLIGTQLTCFLKELPQTVHNAFANVTVFAAAVAPTASDMAAQAHATGGDAPCCVHRDSHAPLLRSSPPPFAYSGAVNSGGPLVVLQPKGSCHQPDEDAEAATAHAVEAECDEIARELLGLAGGWADLTTAAAAAPLPVDDAPEDVWRRAALELHAPVEMSPDELQELRGGLDSYVMQLLTINSDDRASAPTHQQRGVKVNPVDGEDGKVEGDEELLLATGLLRWMKSLRCPDGVASSHTLQEVEDSSAAGVAAAGSAESNLLATWMAACVAHVCEATLRSAVVRVFD